MYGSTAASGRPTGSGRPTKTARCWCTASCRRPGSDFVPGTPTTAYAPLSRARPSAGTAPDAADAGPGEQPRARARSTCSITTGCASPATTPCRPTRTLTWWSRRPFAMYSPRVSLPGRAGAARARRAQALAQRAHLSSRARRCSRASCSLCLVPRGAGQHTLRVTPNTTSTTSGWTRRAPALMSDGRPRTVQSQPVLVPMQRLPHGRRIRPALAARSEARGRRE